MAELLHFLADHCSFFFEPERFRLVDSQTADHLGGFAVVVIESKVLSFRIAKEWGDLMLEFQPTRDLPGKRRAWFSLGLWRGVLLGTCATRRDNVPSSCSGEAHPPERLLVRGKGYEQFVEPVRIASRLGYQLADHVGCLRSAEPYAGLGSARDRGCVRSGVCRIPQIETSSGTTHRSPGRKGRHLRRKSSCGRRAISPSLAHGLAHR